MFLLPQSEGIEMETKFKQDIFDSHIKLLLGFNFNLWQSSITTFDGIVAHSVAQKNEIGSVQSYMLPSP